MESASQVNVPLRSGGKKMRKRRELDALVAHSLAKRASAKNTIRNGVNSQDQLLSPSTDEQDEFGWPRVVRAPNRNRSTDLSIIRLCAPLMFVTCIFLSFGFMYWLYFDLRQQLYQNRLKIEEATGQNLPEALQEWHKTSKNLEKNQTVIYTKMLELQRSLKNLSEDFTSFKNKMRDHNDFSRDQKFVADLGAKVGAVTVDVEGMKGRFNDFQKILFDFQSNFNQLKANFSDINERTGSNSSTIEMYAESTSILKNFTTKQITTLRAYVNGLNETFNQKTNNIYEELGIHTKKLEELHEMYLNTTSHVNSIEDDWVKCREKAGEFQKYKDVGKSIG